MSKVTYNIEEVDKYKFSRFLKANAEKVQGIRNLGEKLGISPNTMYIKMRNPDKLTIEEMRRIRKVLDIDKETLIEELRKVL